jgi:hypothetical protein
LAHQNDVEDVGRLIERVSDEMFDGIIREVVEETGVPASSLVIKPPTFFVLHP